METEGWVQKWITRGMQDCWVKINFKGKAFTICGVGIKSADDCPSRDAESVKISYWDSEE